MARQRAKPDEQPPPAAELSDAEQERAQHDAAANVSEVGPDEFTRGTQPSKAPAALAGEVIKELERPLDPNRIRRRAGRGGGSFEYVAGHDDKRRMNEVFGFGNWSSELIELRELCAPVEVKSRQDSQGWHVGYYAVVRVTIKTLAGTASYADVGYGDGAEYGPAAFVTARELAIKEASTDAFKRAATFLGDQFGLILYAKDDERKRITRERNVQEQDHAVRRDNETPPPRNWTELNTAFVTLFGGGDEGEALREWWMTEVVETFTGKPKSELSKAERELAGQKMTTAYLALTDGKPELDPFGFPTRAALQQAFAQAFDGVKVEGPPWRLGADEQDKPTRDEWAALHAETAGAAPAAETAGAAAPAPATAADDDIPFG